MDQSLKTRILSAVVLIPVTLFALLFNEGTFGILVGVALVFCIKEWFAMTKSEGFCGSMGMGMGYILFCFAAFMHIRLGMGAYGQSLVILLMLSVWATDIGAYFAGKFIGGKKLAPSISPNKTWAGLIGGIVASVLVFGLYVFVFKSSLPVFGIVSVILSGVLIAVAGQAGDLLISFQKRRAGVKDTGNLIPGHGGLLDRIDSLLLASVAFVLILKVMGI